MPKEPKESRVSRFECALQLANETIKARDAEIQELQSRLDIMQRGFDERGTKISVLNGEIERLNRHNDSLKTGNRNLDMKNELLIDEIRNLEEQLQR